jgi:hypothetical protein
MQAQWTKLQEPVPWDCPVGDLELELKVEELSDSSKFACFYA